MFALARDTLRLVGSLWHLLSSPTTAAGAVWRQGEFVRPWLSIADRGSASALPAAETIRCSGAPQARAPVDRLAVALLNRERPWILSTARSSGRASMSPRRHASSAGCTLTGALTASLCAMPGLAPREGGRFHDRSASGPQCPAVERHVAVGAGRRAPPTDEPKVRHGGLGSGGISISRSSSAFDPGGRGRCRWRAPVAPVSGRPSQDGAFVWRERRVRPRRTELAARRVRRVS